MNIPKSTLLEYRMKKLLYYRGFLARRNLSLRSYFYPETVDVTDIDVLGIRFSDNFHPELVICECKSGEGNGTVDRILWLLGLSRYFTATSTMIVRRTIPAKIKNFASEVGVTPIDFERLEELEKSGKSLSEWIGSFDYQYYDARRLQYYHTIKGDPGLSKVYWFVRSRFWYTDNSTRLKQLITALELISNNLGSEASKWLLYESSVLLSVAIIYLCRDTYPLSAKERPEYIANVLTTGLGSPEVAKKILEATYGVVASIIKEKSGETPYIDDKFLRISPPEYTESLIDLVERLTQRPKISVEVPRFLDLVCYEYLLKEKEIDQKKVEEIFPSDTDLIAKMSKNVLKFIIDKKNVPEKIYESLMNF